MLFWLCSRQLIFSLTFIFSNERNVEELLFLDKNLKIQESLCTLVVGGSLGIRFLYNHFCSVKRLSGSPLRQLLLCAASPLCWKGIELYHFRTSFPHLVYFSPKICFPGQKDINLFRINYIFLSTFFCDRRVSVMPTDANTLDSLWCWNSSLLSNPGFCSAVGFLFAENALFYDSQSLSVAADYWYNKHYWKKPLRKTDKQFETHFSQKPFSWILPSSPTLAAPCLWKMRRTRHHRSSSLPWHPHCPKKPVTAKRNELAGYWSSFLSNTNGRSSPVETQPATISSLKEWKIWKVLIKILALESQ